MRDALSSGLRHPATRLVARVLLTCAFWWSGFAKALDFGGTVAEMQFFGLPSPAAAATLTIVVQLVGSALVIAGRAVWLGAGALAVFTVAASVVAHPFWRLPAPDSTRALMTFLEHLGLVGGLVLAAAASAPVARAVSVAQPADASR